MEFGYRFEQLILKATDMGLGTCWMAGTFKTCDLTDKVALSDTEQIVMISPIGYAKSARGFERFMRVAINADKRKPWESLFYSEDFEHPLTRADAKVYDEALEMVRLGPSASNKQPWRIILRDERVDFYLPDDMVGMKEGRYSTAYNDIGIAPITLRQHWLCQTSLGLGQDYHWIILLGILMFVVG